jgi:hypothetical protein
MRCHIRDRNCCNFKACVLNFTSSWFSHVESEMSSITILENITLDMFLSMSSQSDSNLNSRVMAKATSPAAQCASDRVRGLCNRHASENQIFTRKFLRPLIIN